MKTFQTTLTPEYTYILILSMDIQGLSTFTLLDSKRQVLETVYIQHSNFCEENYFEGTVDGLYFGGTCEAPLDIIVTYSSQWRYTALRCMRCDVLFDLLCWDLPSLTVLSAFRALPSPSFDITQLHAHHSSRSHATRLRKRDTQLGWDGQVTSVI